MIGCMSDGNEFQRSDAATGNVRRRQRTFDLDVSGVYGL